MVKRGGKGILSWFSAVTKVINLFTMHRRRCKLTFAADALKVYQAITTGKMPLEESEDIEEILR